ncbi:MAG: tyrosine-type recombinase/integrase [Oscillospiraceae bacterium]
MLSLFCKLQSPYGGGGCAGATYGDALNVWLGDTRLRVKRSTYGTYAGVAERHIRPALGELPASQLTSERVAMFLESAKEELSSSSMRLVCHVLRSSMDYARAMGAPVSPGAEISSPRALRREARVLSPECQRRLEAELRREPDALKLGLLICMHTGMRLGEVCALRWQDFCADCTTVCIRRTVQRVASLSEGGARTVLLFDTPKSASSNRVIPIPASLLPLLRRLRADEACYVLTGRAEAFIEPRRMQCRFKAALRDACVPDINFHALRHTFATNCVGLGCDATTLSRILGHSDVATTLNIYVHPSFDAMRALMDRL